MQVNDTNDFRITVKGKVVRSEDLGVAVQFLKMGEGSFHQLKRLMEYRSGDPERIERELYTPAFEQNS